MVLVPRKLGLKSIDGAVQAGETPHQGLRQSLRAERRQALAQPLDQRKQLPNLGRTLPFGALAQARIGALLIAHLQRLDEQAWVLDHVRPGRTRGVLVVLEPALQFPGGQGCGRQGAKQLRGVPGVGARQRGQHAGGRPGGKIALAHRCEQDLGQSADELQAPADPADIAATAARHLALGKTLAVDQFPQQQGFFQRGERAAMRPREHPQQSLGEIARPGFHPRRVTPEPAQGQDAPVAVDQNQALAAHLGYGDARNELAALFDGASQPLDRPRLQQPRLGET
ncbi:MAG TPA: hypothetical protein VN277_09170 [Acidiferrobacterales bacterium]|nr:hypothetical protein [Acidiferrobacterales bacterium]